MTKLLDVVHRAQSPAPWAEGENIPWNDPSFSERMLREHLSQDHDLASRRSEQIDRHVDWIHREVLRGVPTRILDLGCGPGLYANRLAELGHDCVGVDFSPASVAHASSVATAGKLHSSFVEADVRAVDPGTGFGLVMMLYGQINVFRRGDAENVLRMAFDALAPAGQLLLEPQRYAQIERTGTAGTSWYTSDAGLFSDRPHLVLQESFWDASAHTSTIRFYVVDAGSAAVTRHALSNVAYSEEQLNSLLSRIGLRQIQVLPALADRAGEDEAMYALLARKPS
jgi:SAM-dependent methyltransferase